MDKKSLTPPGLDGFIGEWTLVSPQYPDGQGRVTFEWLEGRSFLLQRSYPVQGPFPATVMIIGLDDSLKTYSVLYHDSRDVSRVYQMSLSDHEWKMWRDAPGFRQRFFGKFSDDGKTIRARWEKSLDGAPWELDFDLIYTNVG